MRIFGKTVDDSTLGERLREAAAERGMNRYAKDLDRYYDAGMSVIPHATVKVGYCEGSQHTVIAASKDGRTSWIEAVAPTAWNDPATDRADLVAKALNAAYGPGLRVEDMPADDNITSFGPEITNIQDAYKNITP